MAPSITSRLLCMLLGACLICISMSNPLNRGDQVAALWYNDENAPAWLDELRPSKRSRVLGSVEEGRLIRALLSDYDRRVRPAEKGNETLTLLLDDLFLKRITNIDENRGEVDIGLWVGFTWNDTTFRWNPEEYNGLKKFTLRSSEIWTPDIFLYTGWGTCEMSLRDSKTNDVEIYSSGKIYYYPSVKVILPCLNVTENGELECNFGMGSSGMMGDKLNFQLKNTRLDTDQYVVDPKYNVKGDSLEKVKIYFDEYPDAPWEVLVARITLEKKATN